MDQLPSHPGRTSVKATHTDQLDLLELQKLDQKESALRHKRDSHPAHATVREFAGRVADLQRAAITQSALIADTTREVTRIEDEIAKVSERRKRQQSRIDNNQVPLRDISAMEHEIAQMDRRLAKLENDQVDAEERVEAARAAQEKMKEEAQAIAADIVPVMGENRILAYHGLRRLNSNPSIGLQAIVEVCGLADRELTMNDIIFKIGPRINASGRMQNGKEAVQLLVETDYSTALEQASHINLYNEARKDLDRKMTEQATEQVSAMKGLEERRGIVIYNEQWHKGIIGIVAPRVTEQYYRPAVVLTRSGDMATGSARSVTGFDVYKAVQSCADLLENFGGHTYAAGLTLRVDKVPEFSQRFEAYVAEHILDEQTQPTLDITAVLDFNEVNFDFYKQLRKFAPFGPGNERPLFCTHRVYDYGTSKVVGRGQEHIRLELVDNKSNAVMNGIAFGQSSQARYIKTRRAFGICYAVEENSHKRGEVQLQIEDIRPCE